MNTGDFIEVYERHVGDVYGFLAYRTHSRPEAEDLTQETFERALRSWSTFDATKGQAKPWLLAIARNIYIDSRRRGSSRTRILGERGMETIAGEEEPPSAEGIDPDLAAALTRLGRREREAIALRFGGDLRSAEIADLLGITVSNAQQILSRALRRLREMLE